MRPDASEKYEKGFEQPSEKSGIPALAVGSPQAFLRLGSEAADRVIGNSSRAALIPSNNASVLLPEVLNMQPPACARHVADLSFFLVAFVLSVK